MQKNEKTKLFDDLYNGILPNRVPISAKLPFEASISYSNLPLSEAQWTLSGAYDAYEKICQLIPTDTMPVGGEEKNPAVFKLLNSQGYSMSSTGNLQHADVKTLHTDEYDTFIKNPMDFLMETTVKRMFKALDTDETSRSLILAKAFVAYYSHSEKIKKSTSALSEKYGFFVPPAGSSTIVRSPFDLLGDFLRGFSGICSDLRRSPQKVKDACVALLPFQLMRGTPSCISNLGSTFIPLHFAGFIRTKDFEEVYWPTLEKFINALAEKGQTCQLFCEHNWMRYLDHLYELPAGTRLIFEYGDPQRIKDKLGKKHILSGLYPLSYLKTATKKECIDKAKSLIDIMAPSGNYVFSFDKNPLTLNSINIDNYIAVIEYVSKNAFYSNAGEIINPSIGKHKDFKTFDIPRLQSKYYNSNENVDSEDPLSKIVSNQLKNYDKILMTMLLRNL